MKKRYPSTDIQYDFNHLLTNLVRKTNSFHLPINKRANVIRTITEPRMTDSGLESLSCLFWYAEQLKTRMTTFTQKVCTQKVISLTLQRLVCPWIFCIPVQWKLAHVSHKVSSVNKSRSTEGHSIGFGPGTRKPLKHFSKEADESLCYRICSCKRGIQKKKWP